MSTLPITPTTSTCTSSPAALTTGLPPSFVLELAETEATLITPLLGEPLYSWLYAASACAINRAGL